MILEIYEDYYNFDKKTRTGKTINLLNSNCIDFNEKTLTYFGRGKLYSIYY